LVEGTIKAPAVRGADIGYRAGATHEPRFSGDGAGATFQPSPL
jgi:hypothetical protein